MLPLSYCRGHTDAVLCVQFDKEKVVSGSKDTTIKVSLRIQKIAGKEDEKRAGEFILGKQQISHVLHSPGVVLARGRM